MLLGVRLKLLGGFLLSGDDGIDILTGTDTIVPSILLRTPMTVRKSILFLLSILTLFVALPLSAITTYILYKHINAPMILWVIWIIQLPFTFFLSFATNALKEKE